MTTLDEKKPTFTPAYIDINAIPSGTCSDCARKDERIASMHKALESIYADFKDVCKVCMFNNSFPDGHFCLKCPTKSAVAKLEVALAAGKVG